MKVHRLKNYFNIGAASVRGPHHIKNELPNQDSYAYFDSDQLIAIAVADGLGSASRSDEGSSFATYNAVYALITYLYSYGNPTSRIPNIRILKEHIIAPWQKRFRQGIADFDTTLLFIGLSLKICVMGQIGDGLIVYRRSDSSGTFNIFHKPEKEYLNNPDSSLAQPNALECLRVQEYPVTSEDNYSAFLLMTDGIADDLMDPLLYSKDLIKGLISNETDHWNAMLNKHLIEWPTPGHYDDKTLVVATSSHQVYEDYNGETSVQKEDKGLEKQTTSESAASKGSPTAIQEKREA